MSDDTLVAEYLVETEAAWINEARDTLVTPYRKKMAEHPYLREAIAGTLPREKLLCLAENTLWLITSFPEVIATFASRCPRYDHGLKKQLLANAWSEHEHPMFLARAVKALGGDPAPILKGPDWGPFQPKRVVICMRYWMHYAAHQLSWPEALAAVPVGIESFVPYQMNPIWKSLTTNYGLSADDTEWFAIHGGEVEMEHGNEGIRRLEKYVHPRDLEMQQACRHAIKQSADILCDWMLETWYFNTP
ncbi:MAG: iron-containing redox enzyme family protein [Candidatus Tectomicrobia bacterium]|nr:iron-containing redox enzyme family protein [Candidatus Tectomicrobia bacterium]